MPHSDSQSVICYWYWSSLPIRQQFTTAWLFLIVKNLYIQIFSKINYDIWIKHIIIWQTKLLLKFSASRWVRCFFWNCKLIIPCLSSLTLTHHNCQKMRSKTDEFENIWESAVLIVLLDTYVRTGYYIDTNTGRAREEASKIKAVCARNVDGEREIEREREEESGAHHQESVGVCESITL
jgi:hypothetical protein